MSEPQPPSGAGTGRVLWIIWCCGWAGFWALGAWSLRPQQECSMYSLTPPGCMGYVTTGSIWAVLAMLLAAGLALAAIRLPVGKGKP